MGPHHTNGSLNFVRTVERLDISATSVQSLCKKAWTTAPESAQAVQDSDDEAFCVSDADSMLDLEAVSNSSESSVTTTTNDDLMPDLVSVSDSSDSDFVSISDDMKEGDGEDWFSDVDEDLGVKDGKLMSYSRLRATATRSSMLIWTLDAAAYVSTELSHVTHTELYDSGTTWHISPYCEMFEIFFRHTSKGI